MELKLVKFNCWLIILFCKEKGDLLQHIFNAPPETLDAIDKTYLEGKLRSKLSTKEVNFIKKEYNKQFKSVMEGV